MKKVILTALVAMSLTSLALAVYAKPILTKPIPATAVPEPEVYPMMLAGLALVGYIARKKFRSENKE